MKLILFILALLLGFSAQAGDYIDHENRANRRAERDAACWWDPSMCNHHQYRQYHGHHRQHHHHRRYDRPRHIHLRRTWNHAMSSDNETGPRCQPRRRVIGAEQRSRPGARKSSELAWGTSIRHDFGVRYGNLDRAVDVRMVCDPSSTTLYLKTVMFTCVVTATPCRASTHDVAPSQRRFDSDEVVIDQDRRE